MENAKSETRPQLGEARGKPTPAIVARMESSLTDLEKRWSGRRRPKAFYLKADDWDAFIAANDWPTVRTMFGNNPPREVVDPSFNGLPVRQSKGRDSRLYDQSSAGRQI